MDKILPTIKPDLIECWPRHLDYPLHRQFIHENRERFAKVIIVFTDMNVANLDYREDIKGFMNDDNISFLDNDPVAGDKDWRNIAVNKALRLSDAEWVWFTEQDLTILKGFWDEVDRNKAMHYDAFGAAVGDRLHPCCIFIKRELIEKTSKYFGVVRDKLDHFGAFQAELNNYTHIDSKTWHHMNGLSQNMRMLQKGDDPNYNPPEFKKYCKRCLEVKPLHPDFEELFTWYVEQ